MKKDKEVSKKQSKMTKDKVKKRQRKSKEDKESN